MGLLSSLLPIGGAIVGGLIGGPAGASIGGQLGGAVSGSGAKNKASNQQIADFSGYETGAIDRSNQLAAQTRADFQPFTDTSLSALTRINALMENPGMALAADPAYQARLRAGVETASRSAAANGMLHSGGTLKALTRYGQDVATDEMDNIFNRNNVLANYGLDAGRANASVGTTNVNALNDALLRSTLGRSSAYADKGQTNSSLYGGIGGAAGELVGGLFGRGGGVNTTPNPFSFGTNYSPQLTQTGPINLPQLTQQTVPNFSSFF